MADARVFIGWMPDVGVGNAPGLYGQQFGSPFGDDDASYREQDDGPAVFIDYFVTNRYLKTGHLYQMPITSPLGFRGESCAFVQLAAPTLLWAADWTASRAAAVPPIPSPALLRQQVIHTGQGSQGSAETWFLLYEFLEPTNSTLAADGQTPVYRVSGTYVFGCLNPSDLLIDSAVIPLPPHYEPLAAARKIPRSALWNGIIEFGAR